MELWREPIWLVHIAACVLMCVGLLVLLPLAIGAIAVECGLGLYVCFEPKDGLLRN